MAIDPRRLAGVAYLTVDGVSYMLQGDLEYQVSKVTRETLTGQDKVHGYAEKPSPGHISGTLRDSGGLSLEQVNLMTNVTVVAELANGKTVVGRNMWTVETQAVNTMEGTFSVRFESESVEEA